MNGRRALSLGVIVALAIAIWVAVQSGDDPAPTSTTASTVAPTTQPPATTATTTASTTSTTAPSTTATTAPPTTVDDEARVEEVRLLLEELYFGWFEAIYHNDEDRVSAVVATNDRLEAFRVAAQSHTYERAPKHEEIQVRDIEILRDAPDCLVVYSILDLTSWLGEGAVSTGVDVLWPYKGSWRRAGLWSSKDDLWQTDCDASRDEQLP